MRSRHYRQICACGKWGVTHLSHYGAWFEWGRTEVEAKPEFPTDPCDPKDIVWTVAERCSLPIKPDDRARLVKEYQTLRVRDSWTYNTPPRLKAEVLHMLDYLCRERPALVCSCIAQSFDPRGEYDLSDAAHDQWRGWKALAEKYMGIEEERGFPTEEVEIAGKPCEVRGSSNVFWFPVITISGGEEPAESASLDLGEQNDDGTRWIAPYRVEPGPSLVPVRLFGRVPAGALSEIEDAALHYCGRYGADILEDAAARGRNKERRGYHLDGERNEYIKPKGGFSGSGASLVCPSRPA